MTVAIAALCGYPNEQFIVAASDQMITSGDIQFEQPQPKIWQLNQSCVAMMYGRSAAQAEIANEVESNVAANKITYVKLIAGIYARKLRDYVKTEAEADVLGSLGLTTDDLIRRASTAHPSQLRHLTQQLQAYYDKSGLADELGGAIIVGVDGLGCHIYGVEHGHVTCYDRIGFFAAGGGEWHASSQFMFAGYTPNWEFPHALSLVYSAKKRAEVAPGVGSQTDIVLISNSQPNIMHAHYNSEFVTGLEKIYKESKERIDQEVRGQHESVKAYFDALMSKAASTETTATTPPPTIQEAPPTQRPPKRDRKRRPPSRE